MRPELRTPFGIWLDRYEAKVANCDWQRFKMFLGMYLGSLVVIGPPIFYLSKGSLEVTTIIFLLSPLPTIFLDVIGAGVGVLPSTSRVSHTFLRGFLGGIAISSCYAMICVVLGVLIFVTVENQKSNEKARKEQLFQSGLRENIRQFYKIELDPTRRIAKENARFWKQTVYELQFLRYPAPSENETIESYQSRIRAGLREAIERVDHQSRHEIHPNLVVMVERQQRLDRKMLAYLEETAEVGRKRWGEGKEFGGHKNLSAEHSVALGVEIMELIQTGEMTPEQFAADTGIPEHIRKRVFDIVTEAQNELEATYAMHEYLTKTYPTEEFPLPE